MTQRLRVALLFGGRSSEHSISCATAGGILQSIDRERFEVIPIGITKSGAMTLRDDDASGLDLEHLATLDDNGTRVRLPLSTDSRELFVDADGASRSLGDIDIVFPMLHGPFGEDGTIQGLIELSGIPYVGNGVLASAVAMDKHFTKTVLEHAGISVVPWVTVSAREWANNPDSVRERIAPLEWPVFVKPARAGSSVGVSKAANLEEFDAAMSIGLAEDSRVLIERAIHGREIEIAVLGGRDGGAPRASLPGEIVITGDGFYDFASKYEGASGIELECPAKMDDSLREQLQSTAIRAFEAIEGAGLSRVDFFVDGDQVIVNEINTLPGFTEISMFPVCWAATGLTYTELISELIDLGLSETR
ncbi:D-alanine--D-alanine ligase family protein [Humidisolicoccus flavus]|uniref:D-alanine--D-alanine ligase family protein n=1 Tax=Humidisolicoccus flavus TaxID=3111414 RepID=UPI00324C3E46